MAETPEVTVTVENPEPELTDEIVTPPAGSDIASAADQVVLAAESAVALAAAQSAMAELDAAQRMQNYEARVTGIEEGVTWAKQELSTVSSALAELSNQVGNLAASVSLLTTPQEAEPEALVAEVVVPEPEPMESPESVVVVPLEAPTGQAKRKGLRMV